MAGVAPNGDALVYGTVFGALIFGGQTFTPIGGGPLSVIPTSRPPTEQEPVDAFVAVLDADSGTPAWARVIDLGYSTPSRGARQLRRLVQRIVGIAELVGVDVDERSHGVRLLPARWTATMAL